MAGIATIFILIAVGAVVFGIVQSQRANQTWSEVAQRLNLSFEEGGWTSNRQMSGRIDGVIIMAHIFSRGSGKSRRTYTGYRADVGYNLPSGLRMHKQGVFTSVAKFFGSQDIEISDPEFDDNVVIKGIDPVAISAFLTADRKAKILSLMHQFSECEIDHEGVSVANRGVDSDAQALEANLRRVADVARNLVRKPERPKPPKLTQAPKVAEKPVVIAPKVEEKISSFEEPAVVVEESIPEPVQQEVVEPTPPVVAPVESEVAKACNAIFLDPPTRYEATRVFENDFKGQTVRWPGVLRRVSEYSYDIVFKSGPGLIAQFEVHEVEGHPYSISKIMASVQLQIDVDLIEKLESNLNEPLFFTGQLVKCDPFSGSLFIENGEILWG